MGSKNGIKVIIIPLVFMLITFAFIFPETSPHQISSSSPLTGRHLLQTRNGWELMNEEEDDGTVRADPLDHFKKYRGGYNITNKHYWSSTIFTGVSGYAIGVVWLLCGISYGGFLVSTLYFCKTKIRKEKLQKKPFCSHQSYLCPILLAAFFTLLAIVASGLVIGGNIRFDREAKSVVKIIMETANGASKTLQSTTGAMKDMIFNLEATNGSNETFRFLTSTSHKLDVQAANIDWQANKNRRLIHKGLNIVYILTMIIISSNFAVLIALSVTGILKLRRPFHLLIVLCWFMTTLCWLLFGLYFFLNNFSSDTCTALERFQENPNNNSLSSILPCQELLTAKSVLTDVSSEIYDLVNEVNTQISVSYPDVSLVCNPFSSPPYYEYQPESCAANTIRIGDIPKVLKLLTCIDEENNRGCENRQFMSNSDYKNVEAYTNSIQDFLNVYPGMESLVECQTVKNAFSKILSQHCIPLKNYAHMVWAGLVVLSIVMVFLVLIWTSKANFERKLDFSDGSVQPNSSTTTTMEMTNNGDLNNT